MPMLVLQLAASVAFLWAAVADHARPDPARPGRAARLPERPPRARAGPHRRHRRPGPHHRQRHHAHQRHRGAGHRPARLALPGRADRPVHHAGGRGRRRRRRPGHPAGPRRAGGRLARRRRARRPRHACWPRSTSSCRAGWSAGMAALPLVALQQTVGLLWSVLALLTAAALGWVSLGLSGAHAAHRRAGRPDRRRPVRRRLLALAGGAAPPARQPRHPVPLAHPGLRRRRRGGGARRAAGSHPSGWARPWCWWPCRRWCASSATPGPGGGGRP